MNGNAQTILDFANEDEAFRFALSTQDYKQVWPNEFVRLRGICRQMQIWQAEKSFQDGLKKGREIYEKKPESVLSVEELRSKYRELEESEEILKLRLKANEDDSQQVIALHEAMAITRRAKEKISKQIA